MKTKLVFCPVGNHVELGYLEVGKGGFFVCEDCLFMFSWDKDGKLLPPRKVSAARIQTCECGSCQTRRGL